MREDGGEVPTSEGLRLMRDRVHALSSLTLDSRTKGLRLAPDEVLSLDDVVGRKWQVLDGDLDLPVLLLKQDELANNVAVMAAYCRDQGVELAPHGKTTMAPQLFLQQLEAGAWGITAATGWQVRMMRSFRVPRILLANELVDPGAIAWVLDELEAASSGTAPALEFLCYVDSAAGIEIIERVAATRPDPPPLPVLVELGYAEGRTGCRTVADALAVAERAAASPSVALAGVGAFEGLMPIADLEARLVAIQRYLHDVHELVRSLHAGGLVDGDHVVVSAGGSAYFDLVADALAPRNFDFPVSTILRSGCYITHDVEMYDTTSLLGHRPGVGLGRLAQALELWATVWSRPSPDLAIIGFGKRDCPFDYRLPVPLRTRGRGDEEWRETLGQLEVIDLNDQHAFVRLPAGYPLEVGDLVVSGINHPCGAFDKWSFIPVVDESYTVVDGIFTFF